MNDQLLAAMVEELATELRARSLGKVWQLARASLALDFRPGESRTLLISVDPTLPRMYLTSQKLRELEKQSLPPSNFVAALRKHLGGAHLRSLTKDANERVVRFSFDATDAGGTAHKYQLIAQLTGRSSNLLLVDATGQVLDALRTPRGAGQQVGEAYQPPPRSIAERTHDKHKISEPADEGQAGDESGDVLTATLSRGSLPSTSHGATSSTSRNSFPPLSAAVEAHYQRLEAGRAFDARISSLRSRLRQETERRRKLERNLARDAEAHGNAAEHKRVGDLLLANISNAERIGARVRLTDYFAEGAPTIELEIDEHASLQEEASRRFARYTRAKRAAEEIARRRESLREELASLEARGAELEQIASARDEDALAVFESSEPRVKGRQQQRDSKVVETRGAKSKKKNAVEQTTGLRRYRSSDGYEILVGRASHDNDRLTFKVARSHDVWLHAADYPGSHVVVRARSRDEDVPHRTLVEAAQLAAYFSQAKHDAKVAVHHTRRKFVSKMKGAAPGLVRLASFRTILVEPREAGERI
jgi:predicted ribosome quality control (RQC) complex YloA/Tae2 family protein